MKDMKGSRFILAFADAVIYARARAQSRARHLRRPLRGSAGGDLFQDV